MRVIINPGCYNEEEKQLSTVMLVDDYWLDFDKALDVGRYAQKVAEQNAALIEMLVEKGVLTLGDCQALGAPHMENAEDLP